MLAIVPFKGGGGAKSRLAPALSEAERALLAADMLEGVLEACAEAETIAGTLLVTPDPSVAARSVDVLADQGTGHPAAIELALADPRADDGFLVVMADCPLVTGEALDALVEAARPLALVPSRDGGVNALALTDPSLFAPRFGVPLEEMTAQGRAAGLEPRIVRDARLELDVDRPEDLELLRARV